MSHLTAALAACVGLGFGALGTLPAHAAGSTISGTITWTRTVRFDASIPGDHAKTGTQTTTGSMRVTLPAAAKTAANGWQPPNRQAHYRGTFTENTLTTTFAEGTSAMCDQQVLASGHDSGATSFSAQVATRGSKRALIVVADPRYSGTRTYTSSGPAGPRCAAPGTTSEAMTGPLSPSVDYWLSCQPKPTKGLVSLASYQIVGTWDARAKGYSFACTSTSKRDDDGRVVTIRVSGIVK